MKKDSRKKENFKVDAAAISGRAFSIPNPIPSWMQAFFKPVPNASLPDINACLIEGYPIEDDL